MRDEYTGHASATELLLENESIAEGCLELIAQVSHALMYEKSLRNVRGKPQGFTTAASKSANGTTLP